MSYNQNSKEGKNLTLACDLDGANINVHLKGGVIIAYQPDAINTASITTITKLYQFPISLVVIPDHNEKANGMMYYDEGLLDKLQYHKYLLDLANSEITIKLAGGDLQFKYLNEDRKISEIIILNAKNYKDTICAKAFNLRGKSYRFKLLIQHGRRNFDFKSERWVP